MYDGKLSSVGWKTVIRQKYDYADSFHNGLALVEHNYKQSIIDTSGKVIVRSSYKRHLESPGPNERIIMLTNSGYGYLDFSGKVVIKPQYEHAEDFNHSRAVISVEENKYGVIDPDNNVIVPQERDFIHDFSEGFAAFTKNGLTGYMNIHGHVVIEPQFANGDHFSCGLARVLKQDRKFPCYINEYGEEKISTRRFSALGFFMIGYHRFAGMVFMDI